MPETREVSLHRYWMWANQLRIQFDKYIVALQAPRSVADLDPVLYLATPAGTFMSLWYAMLFVVAEGWQDLGCRDEEIDRLLQSDKTDLLRRYRNCVCHFQQEWLDHRMSEFCGSPDSVEWVRSLHSAFGRYFLAIYSGSGGEARRRTSA